MTMEPGLKFEEAKAQLDEIVAVLQEKNQPLDEMVRLYEEGTKLAAYCMTLLDQYTGKVEVLERKSALEVE